MLGLNYIAWVLIAVGVLALGGAFAWTHHAGYETGRAEVTDAWNAEKAKNIVESHKVDADLNVIDANLQGANHDIEINKPDLSVVPERVCDQPTGVHPAARPRQPARADGPPTSAAFGAAIIHDVNGYDLCVARLDAAQAALRRIAKP